MNYQNDFAFILLIHFHASLARTHSVFEWAVLKPPYKH